MTARLFTVRQNSDGSVDELVAQSAYVHLEDMGNGNWILQVRVIDDVERSVQINITRKRAFVYESQDCEIVCSDKPAGAVVRP